jgi:hypothetical protein
MAIKNYPTFQSTLIFNGTLILLSLLFTNLIFTDIIVTIEVTFSSSLSNLKKSASHLPSYR